MLFIREHLDGIAAGKIKLAFRKWKKPTVKAGGRLRTPIGVLSITSVETISESDISDRDARLAGYSSRVELLKELGKREGTLYRIGVRLAGEDERIALRSQHNITEVELTAIREKLTRLDSRSSHGPWVKKFLELVSLKPEVRAVDLAFEFGVETKWFKINMRKLKELGLTESLPIGYRLSPRGRVVLQRLG